MVPITVTPSLCRTETSENSMIVAEPWPLLTVTCALQTAAFTLALPRSTVFGSANLPFEEPSATLLVPGVTQLPGVGARLGPDRLTEEDALAVRQLSDTLPVFFDFPAVGAGTSADPVAEIDRVAARRL